MSDARLRPLYLARGEEDEAPKITAFLRRQGTTASDLIVELLGEFDVEGTLREAGLTEAEIAGLRGRLLAG